MDVEKDYYAVNRQAGFDHEQLHRALDEFAGSVIVSYEDHPDVRDLYPTADGWVFHEKEVTRCLANDEQRATEVVIGRLSDWAKAESAKRPRAARWRDIFDDEGESVLR